MPSPSIQKIHLHGDTAFLTSTIQAYLPQQSSFIPHILTVVMQQSRYSVFHAGILLFDLVSYGRVLTHVSVLLLKPLLRVIRAILLKL